MNILKAIILGVIQGFTEFLPVSSSGHFVIASKVFNVSPSLPLIVVLHLGTLFSVFIYFFSDIILILKNFFLGAWYILSGREPFRNIYYSNTNFKIACLIFVATIFTGVLGLTLKDYFERLFNSLLWVGFFFIVTGILIIIAEWFGRGKRKAVQMKVLDAIFIGLSQGIAVAPGLSRSGTTISSALLRNLEREFAARFSFLLSIPAILGAGLIEAKDIFIFGGTGEGFVALIFGFFASFLSGYVAIKVFMRVIQRISIRIFAYYVFFVGFLIVLFFRGF